MRRIAHALAALGVAAFASGCGADDFAPNDLAPPSDLAAPDQAANDLAGATLILTDGDKTRPFTAFYSFYVSPLSETGREDIDLIVTVIDPAYACDGSPQGLDAVSFGFDPWGAGASTTTTFARSGPTLGGGATANGSAQLYAVDARFEGADGGAIFVGSGGSVSGELHFTLGPTLRLDGRFTAPHCAALDFAAST